MSCEHRSVVFDANPVSRQFSATCHGCHETVAVPFVEIDSLSWVDATELLLRLIAKTDPLSATETGEHEAGGVVASEERSEPSPCRCGLRAPLPTEFAKKAFNLMRGRNHG